MKRILMILISFTILFSGVSAFEVDGIMPEMPIIDPIENDGYYGYVRVVESATLTDYGSYLPWRLYSNGILMIDGGFVNWYGGELDILNPWEHHTWRINRIVFTAPVTAGTYLRGLFRHLWNVDKIENLHYLDVSNTTNIDFLFQGTNVRYLDLLSWDVRNVISMQGTFAHMWNLQELNVSTWQTPSLTNMSGAFQSSLLERLDLSSFNTRNVVNMDFVFADSMLREITFGDDFYFAPNVDTERNHWWWNEHMNDVPRNDQFTGVWQSVSGEFVFHASEFADKFNPAIHARTWVWQARRYDVRPHVGAFPIEWATYNGNGSNLPWLLYTDGTLVIERGFINRDSWGWGSPWSEHSHNISYIIIKGPVIGGDSLRSLFSGMWNVIAIEGLHYVDVSNVTDISDMFGGMWNLSKIDLSNWDMRNVVDMSWMFNGTQIEHLTLGENFRFVSGWRFVDGWLQNNPGLPHQDDEFSGFWRNVGYGTVYEPQGEFIFNSMELMMNFDGAVHADTWIFQPLGETNTIYVNGERLYFDVLPMVVDNRTLVPVRAIFEALGYEVEWHADNLMVIATAGERRMEVQIGAWELFFGTLGSAGAGTVRPFYAERMWLDVPAKIVNNRTLVPLRAVSEATGATVEWHAETRTIKINM